MPKLYLEQREIKIILDALSIRPYMEVAALIRKIMDQTAQPENNQQQAINRGLHIKENVRDI